MNAHPIPPRPRYAPFVGLPDLPVFAEMRERRQWVCWDYVWKPEKGKWDKPPVNPRTGKLASSTNPETWGSYEEAVALAKRKGLPGIGIVLTEDDEWLGGDLDDCHLDGFADWAADIVDMGETYTEFSPSGEGIRLIARRDASSAGAKCDPAKVEIYLKARYLTLTGRHVVGTPTEIRYAPRTMAALHERVARIKAEISAQRAAEQPAPQRPPRPAAGTAGSGRASSGDKGEFFRTVNRRAIENLDAWVTVVFPSAKRSTTVGGYRVSAQALGRDLEEDLSLTAMGIVDFGVHDQGDRRDGKRTAIDVVMEHGGAGDAVAAALWLCERLGLDPADLGWRQRDRPIGSHQGEDRARDDRAEDGGRKRKASEPELIDLELSRRPQTDLGNAERFVGRFRGRLMFCPSTGWLSWDGRRWATDGADAAVLRAEHDTVRAIQKEATALADSDQDFVAGGTDDKPVMLSDKLKDWGRKSESASRLSAIAKRAAPYLECAPAELDADPMVINVLNGTLRIAKHATDPYVTLRPHNPADRITKLAAVTYDPEAQCPLFDAFLLRVQPEAETRRFLDQWSGLSLTGDTGEQKLAVYHGKGRNGKSVYAEATGYVAGDYAATVPIETFLETGRGRRGGEATPDLAMLPGVRMLRTSEPEKGAKLAEALIKLATGGEPINARHLNKPFFTFMPSFKLTIQGNYRPKIDGTDEGIWGRLLLVP